MRQRSELARSRALDDGDCSVRNRGVHEPGVSAQRANVRAEATREVGRPCAAQDN